MDGSTEVWFILQRVSTGHVVKVTEDSGFSPPGIREMEGQLPKLSGADLSRAVTALQERQDQWIQQALLPSAPPEHYHAEEIELQWTAVPFGHIGLRTDTVYKDVSP